MAITYNHILVIEKYKVHYKYYSISYGNIWNRAKEIRPIKLNHSSSSSVIPITWCKVLMACNLTDSGNMVLFHSRSSTCFLLFLGVLITIQKVLQLCRNSDFNHHHRAHLCDRIYTTLYCRMRVIYLNYSIIIVQLCILGLCKKMRFALVISKFSCG